MRVRMHYKLMPPSMVLFFSLCCCSLFSPATHMACILHMHTTHTHSNMRLLGIVENSFFYSLVASFIAYSKRNRCSIARARRQRRQRYGRMCTSEHRCKSDIDNAIRSPKNVCCFQRPQALSIPSGTLNSKFTRRPIAVKSRKYSLSTALFYFHQKTTSHNM